MDNAGQHQKSASELENFRREKDQLFAKSMHSPLTVDQKRDFHGLNYFPENPGLALEVDVKEFPEKDQIQMQTSTGDIQTYTRFGRFQFEVEGQTAELTVYADENGYFIPFVDSLSGKESYGAGRYLEPGRLPNGKFAIDFNFAYNPYCAYNERWSCPLTPFENRLKVPIRAGEKSPEGEWVKGL
jgi:uncharacterized protein (DUF1684 family)